MLMLKLDLLASFPIISLTDAFLMLLDVDDEDDEVEVPDTAPLFTKEDVPDGIFLSSGSCCARKLVLFSCRPRMLPGCTLRFTGCPGVSGVIVDVDGGDNVALTAGFWTALFPAFLPLTEVDHDGGDAGDGVCANVKVPRVA